MGDRAETPDDLISSIFGAADPGDQGKDDEVDNDEELGDDVDTGPVDDEDEDQAGDEDTSGEDDEGEGEDFEDALAAKARRGRPPKKKDEDEDGEGDEQAADEFDPSVEVKTDKHGNVYIGKKLVAKAGREARMFMGWRKAAVKDRQEADRLAANTARVAEGARELLTRYNTLKEQKNLFESAGLTAEEQATLLPIALAYKKDPVQGIKLFLTRAHMAGVDIKQLGVGGAIDPAALLADVKSEIAELMKPVRDQTTRSANQEKLRDEARNLFATNPRVKEIAKFLGGSHKLGQILREAKEKAPDLPLSDLFERLDYSLLRQFGGKIPTGPVADKDRKPSGRNKDREAVRKERRMQRNFSSSVSKGNPSFDEIAQSVLRDAKAAESRGF